MPPYTAGWSALVLIKCILVGLAERPGSTQRRGKSPAISIPKGFRVRAEHFH